MKWLEHSHANLLAPKSEVGSLKNWAWIHTVKNNLFFCYKVPQGLLWNSLSQLGDFLAFFFLASCVRWAMNCITSLDGHLLSAAEALYCPLHMADLEMPRIMAARDSFSSLSLFLFFLWRGIFSLGSHIRLLFSSAGPRGSGTLSQWHVGCCQTKVLQTLM